MDIAFIKCYIKSRFCIFCIFCGLLHSGFAFSKKETWFWYSKIKIQPSQNIVATFLYIKYLNQGSTYLSIRDSNWKGQWTQVNIGKTRNERPVDQSMHGSLVETLNWFITIQHFESICDYPSIISVKSTGFLWYLYDISVKSRKK